jgi:DNA-binding protein HU-beta
MQKKASVPKTARMSNKPPRKQPKNKVNTMTKNELTALLSEKTGVTKKAVGELLDAIAEVAYEVLNDDQEFSLHGIGKLSKVEKKERAGRNPQTGEAITIKARSSVKFTAFKAVKDALNR